MPANSKNEFINYKWKGVNRKGVRLTGYMCCRNPEVVKSELRKQNISVIDISEHKELFGGDGPKIKPVDIASLSRQIATMLSAGVPLVQSIELLAQSHDKLSMRKMLSEICQDVSAGVPFNGALRKHPMYFDKLYCDLVAAGEASGALEKIYDQLATYKEKNEALKSKIKKAFMYPTVVVVIATIVTAILLLYVVPQFEEMFSGFGAELPAFTKFVVCISRGLQEYYMIIFPVIFFGIFGFNLWIQRNKKFHDQ